MKRTAVILSAAAAALLGFGSAASAQQPAAAAAPPTAAPQTKIAIINVNALIKGYNKANVLGQQLIDQSKGFAAKRDALQTQMNNLQQQLAKAPDQTSKDNITAQMKKLAREAEDIDNEAQKVITGRQGEIAVEVYKNIQYIVEYVAKSYGMEMVFYYPDATSPQEMDQPATVFRKLSAPAMMPLYVDKRLDITQVVIDTLNKTFPAAAPPAGGAAPAGTVPTPGGQK